MPYKSSGSRPPIYYLGRLASLVIDDVIMFRRSGYTL